jgi:hypothetical protein
MQLMEHKKGNEATNKTVFVEESTVDRMSTAAGYWSTPSRAHWLYYLCPHAHAHTDRLIHIHKHTY